MTEYTILKVTLDNGKSSEWIYNEHTEYDFEGRFFVIKRDNQWVAMYAIDRVLSVELLTQYYADIKVEKKVVPV